MTQVKLTYAEETIISNKGVAMNNLELLKTLADQAEISDNKNAELQVALQQISFYLAHKAGMGDQYAQNLVDQLCKGVSNDQAAV